jgi:hypothetical protein
MRPLFWIAGVPSVICVGFFAVANRHPVAVDLWPLAGRYEIPLVAALAFALYLGFALGAAIAWWAGRGSRRDGRAARRRAVHLEDELARMRQDGTPKTPAGSPGLPATVRS